MVPKFIMAGGQLVKVLIHTGVANYMEFKPVDGSYVYRKGSAGGKIFKVPTTPKEAMKSGLLGMVEKGRMAQFTAWVDGVKLEDRATWCSKGMTGSTKLALDTMSGASTAAHGPAATQQRKPAEAQQRRSSAEALLGHQGPLGGAAEPPPRASPPQAPSSSSSGSSTHRRPSSSHTRARSTAMRATSPAPPTRSSSA